MISRGHTRVYSDTKCSQLVHSALHYCDITGPQNAEFGEIKQNDGHCAPIWVPMLSSYATFYDKSSAEGI